MRVLIPCLLAAALAAGGAPLRAQTESPPEKEKTAPIEKEAGPSLEKAAALEAAIRGLKGDDRRTAQTAAASAFVAVADRHPSAIVAAGRALLRAAQLYEHLKDHEQSVKCLERALQVSKESKTRAMSRNLLGHIYRRARNLPAAIKEYETVLKEHPEVFTATADTMLWLGKCKAKLGDEQAARAIFEQRMKQFEKRERLVIECYDLIAQSYLREGRRDRAKETVDACLKRFESIDKDSGKRAQQLRNALQKMRARRLLAQARDDDPSNP